MLVDTSVWVDHLRRGNARFARHLEAGEVWCHPFVIGELACGRIRNRREILTLLGVLPQAPLALHEEVLEFIEANHIAGSGVGWIDAHLLASSRLGRLSIWTMDRKLASVARDLGASAEL